MTVRIPRTVLIGVGVLLLAGACVAAYVLLLAPGKDCLDAESGASVECDAPAALSEVDYAEQERQAAEEEEALAEAQAVAGQCRSQLGDLKAELAELDSRLSVGLSYDEYGTAVGDVRVEYDQVRIGQLEPACVSGVGLPLEDAMNEYAKAASTWGDCIGDFDCDMDSVDPELQEHWAKAGEKVSDASNGLQELAEP